MMDAEGVIPGEISGLETEVGSQGVTGRFRRLDRHPVLQRLDHEFRDPGTRVREMNGTS